jgi:hypothetical protein
MYVALIQTASSLPFFILALPLDQSATLSTGRKLILFTEANFVAPVSTQHFL